MADTDETEARSANVQPTATSGQRKVWKGHEDFPDHNELLLNDYVKRATRKNVWFYRDRCGVNRGPAPLPILRDAWTHGLIDQNTLVYGQGMVDFLPIKNVRTLMGQIRTWDGALNLLVLQCCLRITCMPLFNIAAQLRSGTCLIPMLHNGLAVLHCLCRKLECLWFAAVQCCAVHTPWFWHEVGSHI